MKAYRTLLHDESPTGDLILLYPITRSEEVYMALSKEEEVPGMIRNGQTLTTVITKLVEEIEYLKKSASDGKSRIASAITEKGVPTKPDATYEEMAKNIAAIRSGEGDARWK